MVTDSIRCRQARYFALTIGAVIALLGVSVAPASASAGTEQQGANLLRSVQAGDQRCQRLSRDQSEAIGEYVMGRMLGSTVRHEAMDRQMRGRTGASGEAQAHVFMGQRFSGCEKGAAPAAFGSMMGMMGTFSGAIGEGMGNRGAGGNGFGPGMMGDSGSRASGHAGWSGTDTLLLVLLGAGLVALVAWRPWRRSADKSPLDILGDRYARGDIDAADYEQRRHALEALT